MNPQVSQGSRWIPHHYFLLQSQCLPLLALRGLPAWRLFPNFSLVGEKKQSHLRHCLPQDEGLASLSAPSHSEHSFKGFLKNGSWGEHALFVMFISSKS